MAVYLDAVGPARKKEWSNRPAFTPECISTDSPWTPAILSALRKGLPAHSLIPHFESALTNALPADKQTEAALGLWVLNKTQSTSQDADVRLSERLARLRADLSDAAARTGPFIGDALLAHIESLDHARWWCLYEAVARTVLQHGATPISVKPGDGIPAKLNPLLLSELLVQMAKGWGDDAVYNSAVFADTVRPRPEDLIAAHSALPVAAHNNWLITWSDWPFALLPPTAADEGDIPSFILTNIELIDGRMGFLREWHLSQVFRPLLKSSPAMVPDVLASMIGDVGQRSARADIFDVLSFQVKESRNVALEVLSHVELVDDPYYRSRALCRLGKYLPDKSERLLGEALSLVNQIDNPFAKSLVLELIVAASTSDQRENIWLQCTQVVSAITDADDRARAWGRLGQSATPAEAHRCYAEALNAAGTVEDEFSRSTTLRLLHPILEGFPTLRATLNQMLDEFGDAVIAARARKNWGAIIGRLAPELTNHHQCRDLWAIIALTAQDDGVPLDDDNDPKSLCARLMQTASAEIAGKLRLLSEAELLECTPPIVQCLEQLLDAGHIAVVLSLLPRLRVASAEVVPFLERQLSSAHIEVIAAAAIMLGELRGLTSLIIPGIIQALSSRNDLLRLRAASLLFGGPQEGIHRASMIGEEGLSHLFWAIDALEPAIGSAVVWFRERLILDSASQIEEWAAELNAGGTVQPRKHLLRSIHHIEPAAWEQCLRELERGTPETKQILLIGISHLTKNEAFEKTGRWHELDQIITRFDLTTLESSKYLIFELKDLALIAVEVLKEGGQEGGIAEAVRQARRLLWARHGQTVADLFRAPTSEARLQNLKAFRKVQYTSSNVETLRWANSAQAAQVGNGVPGFVEFLGEWLLVMLGETLNDPEPPNYERAFLCELLAGAASLAPATFARSEVASRLVPLLSNVACWHRAYIARADAIRLLGYYRRLSIGTLSVLKTALKDIEQVRDAVIEAAGMFRKMDPEVLPELNGWLHDESALLAYAACEMLTTIGRSDHTDSTTRRKILKILAAAVRNPSSQRRIDFGTRITLTPEVPMLSDFFYEALLKVTGYETYDQP